MWNARMRSTCECKLETEDTHTGIRKTLRMERTMRSTRNYTKKPGSDIGTPNTTGNRKYMQIDEWNASMRSKKKLPVNFNLHKHL
ncbi:Hypothetical predicted protein [Pelobates cultripes]|uniref:Uncharacterized protein n=1 Tax=Pelobates cultripes TaxID=61616 RepID=A0AAD1QYH2_PELCU|nr:Hypothetical predicted protein [Pelobates cultripes]